MILFSTADGTLYSLRARTSLSDFEKPSSLTDEQRKELNAKTAAISGDAHKSLVKHHNEIWEVDPDTTILLDGHAPKYARLYVEQVKPPMFEQYDKAIKAAARIAISCCPTSRSICTSSSRPRCVRAGASP